MKYTRLNDERKNIKFLLLGLNALTLDTKVYNALCKYIDNYDYEGAMAYAVENIETYNTLTAVNYLLLIGSIHTSSHKQGDPSPDHYRSFSRDVLRLASSLAFK